MATSSPVGGENREAETVEDLDVDPDEAAKVRGGDDAVGPCFGKRK